MKCIIIDDEPLAHKVIVNYLKDVSACELLGSYFTPLEALEVVKSGQVDLIFLDINMPKLTGLEFLETLTQSPMVIITTAYHEYALKSYEFSVIDYLLKPFSFQRFLQAINKATDLFALKSQANQPSASVDTNASSLILNLKSDKKQYRVDVKDILYLEGYGSYVKVHTTENLIVTLERLTNYEQLLEPHGFVRIHRSYLVAKDKIEFIEGNEVQIMGRKLPIGASYRNQIKHKF